MTGRAAGFCAGYGMPGYANPVAGRAWGGRGGGLGRGRGGRGRRNMFWATGVPGWARAGTGVPAWGGAVQPAWTAPNGGQQLEVLKAQAQALGATLEQIENRIRDIEESNNTQGTAE